MLNLPLAAVGAVGCHVRGRRTWSPPHCVDLFDAFFGGDAAKARDIHRMLLPVYTGVFRTQGVITTKAALRALGRPAGPVRLPLVDLDEAGLATLRADLAAGGVDL